MRDNLAKFYNYLTTEERFRLAVIALGRQDNKEIEALKSTCPRINVSMLDPAFGEKMEALFDICKMFYFAWRERKTYLNYLTLNYRKTVSTFGKAFILGANYAWTQAGEKGPLFDENQKLVEKLHESLGVTKVVPKEISQLLSAAIAELKGLHLAFEKFCDEIDLTVEEALGLDDFLRDFIPQLQETLEKYKDVSPDEESVILYLDAFKTTWTNAMGNW